MEMTGYQKGSLPFRYFEVPISAKRISKMDYEVLMDKIAVRIKVGVQGIYLMQGEYN